MTMSHAGVTRSIVITCSALLLLSACQKNEPAAPEPVDTSLSDSSTEELAPSEPSTSNTPALPPQEAFWNALKTLCDNSYRGQLTIGTEESDRSFGFASLTMHSKRCRANEIDIGFKVDDDDSRTWMFRRTDDGISLHHQHVDETGKPDATSGYGGFTASEGTAIRQEFPADDNTGTMIPAAATNVWAIEIDPGKTYAYELQRIEQQRMFRVVFDLTNPL